MAPIWINTNSNTRKFQSSTTVFWAGVWGEGAAWKWCNLRGKIKIGQPEGFGDSSSVSTSHCWQQSKSSTLRAQRVTYQLKIKIGQCRLKIFNQHHDTVACDPKLLFSIIVMLLKVLCSPINWLNVLAEFSPLTAFQHLFYKKQYGNGLQVIRDPEPGAAEGFSLIIGSISIVAIAIVGPWASV